jgi:hypothetical protein
LVLTKGWRELSKSYKLLGIYSGKRYYFRSGIIAGGVYGIILIIGGNRYGAYLSTLLPSMFCPPLLIPWDKFTGVEFHSFRGRNVRLTIIRDIEKSKDFHNIIEKWEDFNYISVNIADKLEKLSEGRWSYKKF